MTIQGQSAVVWSEMEAESKERNRSDGMDSGCELNKCSLNDDSPYSWRRQVTETKKPADLGGGAASLTNSFSCSSRDLTVDETSHVYRQLAQGKCDFPTCESSAALVTPTGSFIQEPLDDTVLFEIVKKTPCADYHPPSDRLFTGNQRKNKASLQPQVLASLALAIAAMIEGYSSGYTSPALASMTSPDSTIPVNDQQVPVDGVSSLF